MIVENYDKVRANNRQQGKISFKRQEAQKMAQSILEFFADQGINLPPSKAEYISLRDTGTVCQTKTYQTNSKVLQQRQIVCVDNAIFWELNEIALLYYKIKTTNKAIYAMFTNQGVTKAQMIMAWYTKHRLDPVWLMRKSQLIRKLYRNYFEVAMVNTANKPQKLIETLQPYHLTLTVPHANGLFNGKAFYARELAKYFLDLRRCIFWKTSVHGGEYGIEVKPNAINGLHIHIHSLVFLKDGINEHVFEKQLKKRWELLTGGTQVHFEKLFIYKDEYEVGCVCEPWYERINGRKVRKLVRVNDGMGTIHMVQANRYKMYITPQSPIKDYMQGVMECIKYHFKTDAITDAKGNYDVPLMADILNQSKGLRFYSRFGAFYNEELLNFDGIKDKGIDESEQIQVLDEDGETTENINGKAKTAIDNLLNPFTLEPALQGSYNLAVAVPEHLKYSGKKGIPPYSLLNYDDKHFTLVADTNADVTDVLKLLVKNKLHTVTLGKRDSRKNRLHVGRYELDWFCEAAAPMVFESEVNYEYEI